MTDELKPPPAAEMPADKEQSVAAQLALARQLISEQNFINGVVAGFVAMLAAALGWGAIAVATGYNHSLMAIGVGLLVGYGVQVFGRGLTTKYSIAAALLSVLGCIGGNVMTEVILEVRYTGTPMTDILSSLTLDEIGSMITRRLQFMDVIFWLVAIYTTWLVAPRNLTREEERAIYAYEHQPDQGSIIT